jgi:uroporphyrin-3 C-methyltransferase
LQAAQDRITRVQQPGLEGVRRAIEKDLGRLRNARVADLASLSLRLDEAIRLMDDLPLLNAPESQRMATRGVDKSAGKPVMPKGSAPEQAEPPATSDRSAWSDKAWQLSREWAQAVWDDTRGLVRLRRIEHPESILLAPEESFFLRENAKLRLLNARLALLSRQTPTALNDLKQVQAVLPRYFDMGTAKGKRLTQLLQDTGAQAQQTAVPRPDDTLAALAAVSGLH